MNVTDPTEQRDIRRILQIVSRIDPWIEAVSGSDEPTGIWTPNDRSPLSTDDRRTHPYRVSHRVWIALSTAVDFMHCYKRSLIEDSSEGHLGIRLHSYAQLALLRGAVENACTALWLLAPSREERVTNRLRLEWRELRPSYRLRELAGAQPPRTIEQREDQLVGLMLGAGYPSDLLPRCTTPEARVKAVKKTLRDNDYAKMVARAGEHVAPVGGVLAEATWRACSGLAHGDQSATLGLLGNEVVRKVEPGVNLMRVSASVQLLYAATTVAFLLTADAFETLRARVQTPYL